MAKNKRFISAKRSEYQLGEEIKSFFMKILNSFILNSLNLYLMPSFIAIKNFRGRNNLCALRNFSADRSY